MLQAYGHSGSISLAGGVRLRWADTSEYDGGRSVALLTSEERRRLVATELPAARERFLLGRLLLRELASEVGGLPIEAVVVAARCERCGAEHGRPRVEWAVAGGPSFAVSLAASDRVVVAVVSPDASRGLGVDVELSRAAPFPEPADPELEVVPAGRAAPVGSAIASVIGGSRRGALRRWVRAEAVLKADGRGLRVDPRAVRVSRGTGSVEGSGIRYRVDDLRVDGCLISVARAEPE